MPHRLAAFLSVILGLFAATLVYGLQTYPLSWPALPSPVVTSTITTSAFGSADTIPTTTGRTNALVVHAIDGDTLLVRIDGELTERRVRLLGINTPETVDPRRPVECFGREASAHMHTLVDGARVRLEADPLADERDKYDRLLRNAFLPDGTDINAAMVRDGYAYAYLSFPLNPYRKRELKKMQEDAKLAQRGLWNPNTCNGNR